MLEIDGDRAGSRVPFSFGEQGRELEEPLSPNEITVERGSQGIAPPGGSVHFPTSFSQESIIHRRHKRGRRFQVLLHRLPNGPKQGIRIEARVFKQAKIGRPIGKLTACRGDEPGDGMPSQTKQGAESESFGSLKCSLLRESGACLLPEFIEGFSQSLRRFFLSDSGGGLSRRRRRWALSRMIHSTISPRWNSMACAMAEGKLMYHCSLCFRLMSWTLVGYPIVVLLYRI